MNVESFWDSCLRGRRVLIPKIIQVKSLLMFNQNPNYEDEVGDKKCICLYLEPRAKCIGLLSKEITKKSDVC